MPSKGRSLKMRVPRGMRDEAKTPRPAAPAERISYMARVVVLCRVLNHPLEGFGFKDF